MFRCCVCGQRRGKLENSTDVNSTIERTGEEWQDAVEGKDVEKDMEKVRGAGADRNEDEKKVKGKDKTKDRGRNKQKDKERDKTKSLGRGKMDDKEGRGKDREKPRSKDKEKEFLKCKDQDNICDMDKDKDLVRDRDLEKDKNLNEDEDPARDTELNEENDLARDREQNKDKDLARDIELNKEKDLNKDKDLTRGRELNKKKDLNKDKDVTKERELNKEKDLNKDKNRPNGDVQMRQDDDTPKKNIAPISTDSILATPKKKPILNGPRVTSKNNIYDGPAYIERTIYDGPEDEGDDSVFETCPGEETPPDVPAGCVDDGDDDDVFENRAPLAVGSREDGEDDAATAKSDEDDDDDDTSEICGGMQEPPATPVARDELALRRHRFFSDLLQAAQNSAEHRVRFDPLGPMVHVGCEGTADREDHLEELVNRLENVTRRLERVPDPVRTQEIAVQTSTPSPKRKPDQLATAKQSVVVQSTIEPVTNMSVTGYEDLLAGPVREYLQLSEKIGGDVAAHSKLVEKAFQIQLQFLQTAASRPAPSSQSEQVGLLGPTSSQIQQIQDYREKNRGSPFFNHLSAISESIPALGWVAVAPTPAPYVKEMNDAGQFYTNRVLKDWKEKDKTHAEWCKAWVQTLSELQQYVRQHHTTGLVWAKTGSSVPPPPPPACGAPPPPPTMPAVGDMTLGGVNDDRSALFAQINQGEGITKNLKKVTSDMQTHKNPSLRTGPAPFKAPASNSIPMKAVPPANAPIDKPPVFTKDGKKWLVEYHKGNKDLLVDNVEMNNVIYMFRCQDSTLIVKGKVNSIVMDSCRKSSVVFDSVVSSIEFVNCQSVQMQVLGKVPTISIDKTDGCQMYLSPESLDVELITSKSSEMNVMVPKGNGDYTEYPVPEQFKTTVSQKGLSTIAVDSLG